MPERRCPTCNTNVTGRADKVYCTEPCRKTAERKRLEVPKPTTCTMCGAVCMRHKRADRLPFCDWTCRDLWFIESHAPIERKVSVLPKDHPARWHGSTSSLVYGSCSECDTLTCSRSHNPKVYCSTTCRRRASNRRRNARRRKSKGVSQRRRLRVHIRDNWTCWLCGGPTIWVAVVPHPLAPTVDHLIPRVNGGTHDESNLGTAHFICNSRRGASHTNLTHTPL